MNPFELAAHLADDHGIPDEVADALDADEARAWHANSHSAGADHYHE